MLKYIRKNIFIFLIFFTPVFCKETKLELADTNTNKINGNGLFSDYSKFQLTFGYWNDNLIIDKIFNMKIKQGIDDFVTASFWNRICYEKDKSWWLFDSYFNIITHKKLNYRTDLLSLRISRNKKFLVGYLHIGSGIIVSGDLGGGKLQKMYHNLFRYKHLTIPYKNKKKYGLLLYQNYKIIMFSHNHLLVNIYLGNSYRSKIGPSIIRNGLTVDLFTYCINQKLFLQFQTAVGYMKYYKLNSTFTPIFHEGFNWGTIFTFGFPKKTCISSWFTFNQYGLKQPHFGLLITFKWKGNCFSDLLDVEFP